MDFGVSNGRLSRLECGAFAPRTSIGGVVMTVTRAMKRVEFRELSSFLTRLDRIELLSGIDSSEVIELSTGVLQFLAGGVPLTLTSRERIFPGRGILVSASIQLDVEGRLFQYRYRRITDRGTGGPETGTSGGILRLSRLRARANSPHSREHASDQGVSLWPTGFALVTPIRPPSAAPTAAAEKPAVALRRESPWAG